MQQKKKDQQNNETLLSNHLEIQEHHQQILKDLLQKPTLQQPEVVNSEKHGLTTPNQQYAKQLQTVIKEGKNKKQDHLTY